MQLDELIRTEIAQVHATLGEKFTAGITPIREELDRMATSILDVQRTQRDVRRDMASRLLGTDRPRVADGGPYHQRDALDLAIARSLLGSILARPEGIEPDKVESWKQHLTAALDSTTSAKGDELVPTAEDDALWMDVNMETLVWDLFQHVRMPTNPFDIPLQLGDIDWYPGTANVATKSTDIATAKQTLTAYEIVGQIPWAYELDEDAVVAMLEEVHRSITRNYAELLDDLAVNADTTVTDGINSDGATIAKTTAGKGHWLLGFDGLAHLPLVDNTGQGNSVGGAVSAAIINDNRSLMGKYGVRPSEVVHLMDLYTYLAAIGAIAEVQTLEKYGPQATILTGELGRIEGIPIIVPELMLRTAYDGKVTDGSTGTVGRVLTVNRTQWRTGSKRDLLIETDRDSQKRQTVMTVSARIAFAERSGTLSTATHTAMQYNITGI